MKRQTEVTVFLTAILCLGLQSCGNDERQKAHASEPGPADNSAKELFGARFKEGKGVELAEEMKRSLQLETAEVTEEALSVEAELKLHVFSVTPVIEASANLDDRLAQTLKVGAELQLAPSGGSAKLKKLSSRFLSGDLEGTFEISSSGEASRIGDTLTARLPPTSSEAVAVIPASALLETVSGTFVYVVNGKHFIRTAVKTGRSASGQIEITDGLYAGDEVVKTPVKSLWYAELQALRGGTACADGH